MQLTRWWLRLVLALIVAAGLLTVPPAAAMVIVGGGAGILVDGVNHCTLTTIGHDRTGDVVGFTSSRCGGPGATVALEGSDTTVGTVVAANGGLGYAVIRFDAPDLLAVSDYAGAAIHGIGPDPVADSYVCKWGPATPGICNHIWRDGWPDATMYGRFEAGDVGAPITMDGRLAGMAYHGDLLWRGRYAPPMFVTFLTKFRAILEDVNAGDGPGNGFVPIGG